MSALLVSVAALLMGQPAGFTAPTDPRIQLVRYDPGQVVTLPVGVGYAAVVELSPDERVDSVVVGNAAAWQVTASKRGDQIVVKPLTGAAATDMVVTTAERRYVFLLEPASEGSSPFVLRFAYPEAEAVSAAPAVPIATYRFRGAKALLPLAMHDDGRRTTISWGHDKPIPAMFAIGRNGKEALVNGRMVGDDYVVEGVAPEMVFRLGAAHAEAIRRTDMPK